MIPKGEYPARCIETSLIEVPKSEAIAIAQKFQFQDESLGVIWGRTWIVGKDGALQEKAFERLASCYPGKFNKSDPADIINQDLSEFEVILTIEITTYEGKERNEVAFINPPGAGSGVGKAMSRDAFMAKVGAKLRARFGTSVSKPNNPVTPPVAKKPTPPKVMAPVSTMEACWDALMQAQAGQPETVINGMWEQAVQQVAPNAQKAEDLTPQDWGKVLKLVSDNVPM